MKFVFVQQPRVWWPVSVRVPADGGATEEAGFEAWFAIVPASRFSALMEAGAKELLAEVLIGWRGIVDADGAVLPFDAAAREALLDTPFIAHALAEAYAAAMLGGARKN